MDPVAFWWQEFEAGLSEPDPHNLVCRPNQSCSYMALSYTAVSILGIRFVSFRLLSQGGDNL